MSSFYGSWEGWYQRIFELPKIGPLRDGLEDPVECAMDHASTAPLVYLGDLLHDTGLLDVSAM
jgi:hypothetical protein